MNPGFISPDEAHRIHVRTVEFQTLQKYARQLQSATAEERQKLMTQVQAEVNEKVKAPGIIQTLFGGPITAP